MTLEISDTTIEMVCGMRAESRPKTPRAPSRIANDVRDDQPKRERRTAKSARADTGAADCFHAPSETAWWR